MYEKMASQITAATLVLKTQAAAAEDIDRVLTTMMIESRPVYVGLSVDIGYLEVDDSRLKTPLSIELPPNDASVERKVVEQLRAMLEKANHPAIIVDGSKSL
jgi:pyruvate decarboxylase